MVDRDLENTFKLLKNQITGKKPRAFIDDLREQIEEDETMTEIVRSKEFDRLVAVTYDRRRHDSSFSYHYFDLVLVTLDAIAGGTGIIKPANQVRVITWRARRKQLVSVLSFLRRNNPQIKFRRLLVLPFPQPIAGVKVDLTTYMQ